MRRFAIVGLFALLAGCGSSAPETSPPPDVAAAYAYPAAPTLPTTRTPTAALMAAERVVTGLTEQRRLDENALRVVVASRDPRLAWVIADLLRFIQGGAENDALVAAFRDITGVDPSADPTFASSPWQSITNHLIAWDQPSPPGYREIKGRLFTVIEPGWRPFFADANADIDWRILSWGGVLIDDRPGGSKQPCERGCIPALDDPALTSAAEGRWYPDERLVFGVEVNGEAVAFPKNIMEVHEMVNLTIGGRRVGIPYCTLCGSAQAYLTDAVPAGIDPPILRTSGLLSRSNKVMYDLRTRSVFDTFTGRALSGPLHTTKFTLRQVTLVTSTWGEWKAAHPATRIVARDGGLGRSYEGDPLGGRDDNGPIFPIGPADKRLPVQARVVGVEGPSGPVAFPVDQVRATIDRGERVAAGDVELVADGGGFRAQRDDGTALVAHESFWFAWSQFKPATIVWTPLGG